jgi:hypothetical protein
VLTDGRGDDGPETKCPEKEGEAKQRFRVGDSKCLRYVVGPGCVDGRREGPVSVSQDLSLVLRLGDWERKD